MEILEKFKDIIQPIHTPFIIEFGSCTGEYTRVIADILQLSTKEYTFHCFEPNPDTLSKVVDKLQYYLISNSKNVRLFNEAICSTVGKVNFYKSTNPTYYGSSSIRRPNLVKKTWNDMTFSFVQANGVTFDYHLQRTGFTERPIDFVFCDIQGGELDLIDGGKQAFKNVRYIYMAYCDSEMYGGQLSLQKICEHLPDFEIIHDYKSHVLLKNKNRQ